MSASRAAEHTVTLPLLLLSLLWERKGGCVHQACSAEIFLNLVSHHEHMSKSNQQKMRWRTQGTTTSYYEMSIR